jgi:uncharacterized membrane protein YdjX (TVP38/TMEM64 family)
VRRLAPLLLLGVLVGLFLAGHRIRTHLGLELSPASIQGAAALLGWKGPVLFVGLVTFRQFLLLPSALVLPAGGVVFGALEGTVLGALGIVLSAILKYSIARGLGREWLRARFGAGVAAVERHAAAAGPLVVGMATAHPMGPMSPSYWAAGLAAVPVLGFVVAVVLAAPVRAFAYAFFGSTLLEPGTPRFWAATALLAAAALLPLAHPRVRGALRRGVRRAAAPSGGPDPGPPSA